MSFGICHEILRKGSSATSNIKDHAGGIRCHEKLERQEGGERLNSPGEKKFIKGSGRRENNPLKGRNQHVMIGSNGGPHSFSGGIVSYSIPPLGKGTAKIRNSLPLGDGKY